MNMQRNVLFFLTLCLAASAAQAQLLRSGEIRINPKTTGAQSLPDVATAADGRFVVVWQEGDARPPSKTLVAVKARLFDAAGKPRSGEIEVARHVPTSYPWPRVAMAPDGRFVVVWGGGKEDSGIAFGRRFAADGSPQGQPFRLATIRGQDSPDVAMAADGSFVAAWTQGVEGDDEVNTDVYFRRFGANGRPLGPEAVAIDGFDEQSEPQVALRPNGDFVIVCQKWVDPYDIAARIFSRDGTPLSDRFRVNDGPTVDSSQSEQAVAVAPDGRFAVVWTDWFADYQRGGTNFDTNDPTGVGMRVFAADGTPLGPSLFVNDFVRGTQGNPVVSTLRSGGFLVAWTSGAGQDGDELGIFSRIYSPEGQPKGPEFRVNINRAGSQALPTLAIAPNGQGVAAWQGPDGDKTGIFARLLGLPRKGS